MNSLPESWYKPYANFQLFAPVYQGNSNAELESTDEAIQRLFEMLSVPLYRGGTITEYAHGKFEYAASTDGVDVRPNYAIAATFMQVIISKFGVNAKSRWAKRKGGQPNCWKPANRCSEAPGEISLYHILQHADISGDKQKSENYPIFHRIFWNKKNLEPDFKPLWTTTQVVPQWDVLNSFRIDSEVDGCEDPQEQDGRANSNWTTTTHDEGEAELLKITTSSIKAIYVEDDDLIELSTLSAETAGEGTARPIVLQPAKNDTALKGPEDVFQDLRYSAELMPPNFEQGVVFKYIDLSDLAFVLPDDVCVETVESLLPCRNGRILVRQPYMDIMKRLYTKAHEALRSSLPKKQVKDTITVLGSAQGEPPAKTRTRDFSLVEKTHTAVRALKKRHVIITGHPGIGKTYFLSFIHYWRTLHGQESIIQVRKNWHFYFSAAGVVEFQSIAQAKETGLISRDILSNENIWYISDGQPDDMAVYESKWMIVVISSPKAETFKDFQKQFSVETLYMPPFSWNEIFATSVFCEFLKGDQIYTIWRNFVLYGPSARILLNELDPQSADYQPALQNYKDKLETKILHMLQSDLTKQIQKKWLDTDSHAVILIAPSHTNFLQKPVRSFITPYVGQLFANTQDAMVRGECVKLFLALENVPDGSTFRGRIFEALFHKLMERKTLLLYQTIGNPHGARVAFSPSKTHVFNRLPLFTDMIRAKKGSPNVNRDYLGVYFRPVIPNFQSVDSFTLLDGMVLVFQITCAQSHPVKATGLAELCAAMPHEAQTWPWRLVFVLPEKQVATWKAQEIKCFDKQELVDRWARIGQEVMGVPDSVLHKELDER